MFSKQKPHEIFGFLQLIIIDFNKILTTLYQTFIDIYKNIYNTSYVKPRVFLFRAFLPSNSYKNSTVRIIDYVTI